MLRGVATSGDEGSTEAADALLQAGRPSDCFESNLWRTERSIQPYATGWRKEVVLQVSGEDLFGCVGHIMHLEDHMD